MTKKEITQEKLKDWFIIQRIRILNFIKEHKYLSAGIGVFLLSFIVYLVVFAEDDPYKGKVTTTVNVTQKGIATTEEISEINSFSTIVYDVSYSLSTSDLPEGGLIRNEVVIEAIFNDGIDAEWVTASDESTDYVVNGNKLTITLYSIKVGEHKTKQIYLKVNNVKDDGDLNTKEVITRIRVKEGTSDFGDEITKDISIKNKEVSQNTKVVPLTYELVDGTAYKDELCKNGRCAPFGIVLGIDKAYLDENGSLEGLYFEPSMDLILSATDSNNSQLELLTEKNTFGTYESQDFISDMPNKPYDSGDVTLTPTTDSGVSGSVTDVSTPEIYLVGEKDVVLKLNESYVEHGIKIGQKGSSFCMSSTMDNGCKRTIIKEGNEVNSISTAENGEYTILYEYTNSNFIVTLKRNVRISGNKNSVTLTNGTNYTVKGNEIETILVGSTYSEKGLEPYVNHTSVITKEDDDAGNDEIFYPSIDTNSAGKYKITYTINEGNESYTLTRIVSIVENLQQVKAQTLTASTVYSPIQGTFTNSFAKIDGKDCEQCDVSYYSDSKLQNKIEKIDSSKPGTYYAKYSITDANDFELNVINTVNFQVIYKLGIENIKSNGNINIYNDNIVVLGTYYVNAISPREAENKNDIYVTLIAGNKSSTVTNHYYSAGTKNSKLSFYTDDLDDLTETEVLTYGEEVILKSEFGYLSDGDDNVTSLVNTIDFSSSSFSMINYMSDIQMDIDYFLSINGKRITKIDESGSLYYLDGDDSNKKIEGMTFKLESKLKEDKQTLNSIKYSINGDGIKPGTLIDFRVRLKTQTENEAGKTVTVPSNIVYKQNGNSESKLSSASILITAFKARTSLLIDDCDYDIVLNGAATENQSSIWTIYPSLVMPAGIINTNAAGINIVDTVKITVTLPKEINYVYNENYVLPDNVKDVVKNNDGAYLVYTLKNKQVNEWIDPIMFETNYDVDIPSGSDLVVTAVIEATTANEIKDVSSAELRTTKRKITYQNNEELATSMYTTHQSVAKDTSFDINTVIYRNAEKDYENFELITILPYNDGSKENSFSGVYKLLKIPSGALCTNISNIKDLDFSNKEIWSDCRNYKDNNYQGVTAIKEIISKLDSNNKYFNSEIELQPIGNKSDDNYTTRAYVIDSNANKIIEIPSLTVSVVSKKITGIVWEDFDVDGLMDNDEKKVADVVLKLYDAKTNKLVTSSVSDSTGKYVLSDLEPGNYYVAAEYNTSKYGLTTKNNGNDKSIISVFSSPEKEELENNNTTTSGDNGETIPLVKTETIEIDEKTKMINNINLGLVLEKEYSVKLNKYITKAVVTNNLGVSTEKDYGKASLAKLDVKDINNLNIKVVYTLELENIGYYPGYIYNVKDYIPDGMIFNEKYEENKGWTLNEDGYVENNTLFDELIYSGDKKYLTIAFDIERKEAGSFINYAKVEDEDLQILVLGQENGNVGD